MAWSSEQLQNARIIAQVGRRMGMGDKAIRIALATALQESTLRNLNYGDRDSLGLFQQRPSQGWGTTSQVTDPEYASRKFYESLRGVRGWENMALTQAAQAVQRSAFPDAYAKWEDDANGLLRELGVDTGTDGQPLEPLTTEIQEPQLEALEPLPAVEALGLERPEFEGIESDWTPAPEVDLTALEAGDGEAPGRAPVQFDGRKAAADGIRGMIVAEARKYLGTPYVWGGSSPGGFDCSGLLQYVFKKFGVSLPRVSAQQASYGKRVGLGDLQAGDLVAWDNSSRNNGADHIALYIGNGMILEAPRTGLNVRIRRLDDDEGAWGVAMNI